MKIIIVNSKIKNKSETILGVIKNLLLDFILYFVNAYMRKYPIHVTSAKVVRQNTLWFTCGSKQQFVYDEQFTTVTTQKNV